MPGVPSGRGCEACRKQKKKPSCSRCRRLCIKCIGCGVQRFKFKEDSRSALSTSWQITHRPRIPQSTLRYNDLLQPLSSVPSSTSTLLTNQLIENLASDDLRYHLSWSYGGFLDDIPRRIGVNAALDSAVAVLLASHSNLRSAGSTKKVASIESLIKYSHAVKTLQGTLNDPENARTPETLCAITLLLISQSFIGGYEGHSANHAEGAAQVLKARRYFHTKDDFESHLMLMLRGPVLFEAILNPRISFTRVEWRDLVERHIGKVTPVDTMMTCVAHLPDIIQRGTIALYEQADLGSLISETSHQYLLLMEIRSQFFIYYNNVRESPYGNNRPRPPPLAMIHCHYQRMYGLVLTVCLFFNCILKALNPNDATLELQSAILCKEVLEIAEEAAVYRPIGASYVGLCLAAAWCSCSDPSTKVDIEIAAENYRMDFVGVTSEIVKTGLESWHRRLSLSGTST